MPEPLVKMLPGHCRKTQKVSPLADEDDDADSGREPDDHRGRDEADHGAHAGNPHEHQHRPRHQCCGLESGDAVARGDAGQYGDERPGRSGDLHPAATEERDKASAEDRGVQPLLRAGAGGDRESHRQRQGDYPDDQPGHDVG